MSDLPHVRPAAPEQPATTTAAGTRPALDAIDVIAFLCELFAFGTLAVRYIPILMQPRIDGREH